VVILGINEIKERASQSKHRGNPFVEKVWDLIHDPKLFTMSADELAELRIQLMRESLAFFRDNSDYYASLFERLDIVPEKAERKDLVKLVVPADMLRGGGQERFVIDEVDEGGEHFQSSGTTGKAPVKIYRSPLDLAIMVKANADLFEYVYGHELEENKGLALFMAAPELRNMLSFVAFVELALESKGIELLYGMSMREAEEGETVWQRLQPDKKNILRFLKSKDEPKFFFTAPAGVYLMSKRFNEMSNLKREVSKIITRAPPVNLGKGGVIVTGGGSKGFVDLPPYAEMAEGARNYFKALSRSGDGVEAPFMDVLGMTETLTALIDNHDLMGKVPHPLSEIFLVDPKTFELIDEPGKEGLICIYNPFVTTWLEAFFPGDIMLYHASDRYYGKEFEFGRRLTVKEGWDLQRACGGTLEELMEE